jgi:hypothetical protein
VMVAKKTLSVRFGLAGGEDKAGGVYQCTNLIGYLMSCWDDIGLASFRSRPVISHSTIFLNVDFEFARGAEVPFCIERAKDPLQGV